MTTTTACPTKSPMTDETNQQAPALKTGDQCFDVATKRVGVVTAMNPDSITLRAGDDAWETEWSSIAVMRFGIQAREGLCDPDLVCERGGDPFYDMECEIELVRDRVMRRLENMHEKADCPSFRLEIRRRRNLISVELGAAESELTELSNQYRIDWLRGRLGVVSADMDDAA